MFRESCKAYFSSHFKPPNECLLFSPYCFFPDLHKELRYTRKKQENQDVMSLNSKFMIESSLTTPLISSHKFFSLRNLTLLQMG